MSSLPAFDANTIFENGTDDQILDWVILHTKNVLGYPIVNIEVDDNSQIKTAVEDSLRIFNKWMGEIQTRVAYERSESVVIQLENGARGVVECKMMFPESYRQPAKVNIFELIHRMVIPRFPVSDWYLFRSFYEMFQQVKGTEPDWRYDEFTKRLYVDCWNGPYDIVYTVVTDMTLRSFYTGKRQYLQDFLDLVVARTKQILARVMGKYGNSIPAPGNSITTDAQELRQDGMAREKEIVEYLQKRSAFTCVGFLG